MRSVFSAAILTALLCITPAQALEVEALNPACKGHGVLSAISQGLSREWNFAKLLMQKGKAESDVAFMLAHNSRKNLDGYSYSDLYILWDELSCRQIRDADPAAGKLVNRWAKAIGSSPGQFGTTVAYRHYVRKLANHDERFRTHLLTDEEKQLLADTLSYAGKIQPGRFGNSLAAFTARLQLPPPQNP